MEDGSMNGVTKEDGGKMNGASAASVLNGAAGDAAKGSERFSLAPVISAGEDALNAFVRAHALYSMDYETFLRATLSVPFDSGDRTSGSAGRTRDRAEDLAEAGVGLLGALAVDLALCRGGEEAADTLSVHRVGALLRAMLHQQQVLTVLWFDGGGAAAGFFPPAEVREVMIVRGAVLLALLRETEEAIRPNNAGEPRKE